MTSWKSRKQPNISPNTIEATYITVYSTSFEPICLRMLFTDLFDLEMEATVILCDNQSCIKMMCSMMSQSTKRFGITSFMI
jgi:hypothetical protein